MSDNGALDLLVAQDGSGVEDREQSVACASFGLRLPPLHAVRAAAPLIRVQHGPVSEPQEPRVAWQM